jgi:hypothetical protein
VDLAAKAAKILQRPENLEDGLPLTPRRRHLIKIWTTAFQRRTSVNRRQAFQRALRLDGLSSSIASETISYQKLKWFRRCLATEDFWQDKRDEGQLPYELRLNFSSLKSLEEQVAAKENETTYRYDQMHLLDRLHIWVGKQTGQQLRYILDTLNTLRDRGTTLDDKRKVAINQAASLLQTLEKRTNATKTTFVKVYQIKPNTPKDHTSPSETPSECDGSPSTSSKDKWADDSASSLLSSEADDSEDWETVYEESGSEEEE